MAEQRVNGLGQTVEFNENTGRWNKVVNKKADTDNQPGESDNVAVTTDDAGTFEQAPDDGEEMVNEGAAPMRRARSTED